MGHTATQPDNGALRCTRPNRVRILSPQIDWNYDWFVHNLYLSFLATQSYDILFCEQQREGRRVARAGEGDLAAAGW